MLTLVVCFYVWLVVAVVLILVTAIGDRLKWTNRRIKFPLWYMVVASLLWPVGICAYVYYEHLGGLADPWVKRVVPKSKEDRLYVQSKLYDVRKDGGILLPSGVLVPPPDRGYKWVPDGDGFLQQKDHEHYEWQPVGNVILWNKK